MKSALAKAYSSPPSAASKKTICSRQSPGRPAVIAAQSPSSSTKYPNSMSLRSGSAALTCRRWLVTVLVTRLMPGENLPWLLPEASSTAAACPGAMSTLSPVRAFQPLSDKNSSEESSSLYTASQVVPSGPSVSTSCSPSTPRRAMGASAQWVTSTPYSSASASTSSFWGMSWSAR